MVSTLPQRQEPVLSGSNEALWGGEGVASRRVYNARIYLQSCCCGQEDEVDVS